MSGAHSALGWGGGAGKDCKTRLLSPETPMALQLSGGSGGHGLDLSHSLEDSRCLAAEAEDTPNQFISET